MTMIELLIEGSGFIRNDTNKSAYPKPIGKPALVQLMSREKPPKGEVKKIVKRLQSNLYFYTTPGDYEKPEGANAFCLGDPITDKMDTEKEIIHYKLAVQYYKI